MKRVRFDPIVAQRIETLGARDRDVVRENILQVQENPRDAGHPSFLRRAKLKAWQHVCPHSWVVLFRWQGGDETQPFDLITIEDLVERY